MLLTFRTRFTLLAAGRRTRRTRTGRSAKGDLGRRETSEAPGFSQVSARSVGVGDRGFVGGKRCQEGGGGFGRWAEMI